MAQPRMDWTWEMWEALPEDDGNRYEIIDGELLVSASPSWTHQRVLALLFAEVFPYLMQLGNHEILFAPGGVRFNDRRVLQPDLTAWRFSGEAAGAAAVGDNRTLILTVEALSPSTARYDRYKKRPVFQEQAVPSTGSSMPTRVVWSDGVPGTWSLRCSSTSCLGSRWRAHRRSRSTFRVSSAGHTSRRSAYGAISAR